MPKKILFRRQSIRLSLQLYRTDFKHFRCCCFLFLRDTKTNVVEFQYSLSVVILIAMSQSDADADQKLANLKLLRSKYLPAWDIYSSKKKLKSHKICMLEFSFSCKIWKSNAYYFLKKKKVTTEKMLVVCKWTKQMAKKFFYFFQNGSEVGQKNIKFYKSISKQV